MPTLKYWDTSLSQYVPLLSTGGAGGGGGPPGFARSVNSISGNTTLGSAVSTDYVYACTAALTATLPTAVGNTNKYSVNNRSTGTVTVATTANQTINGASTFSIPTQYMSVDFISDGAEWMVV